MGKIEAICISTERGTPKHEIADAYLKKDFGIEGDAHGGNWHRQISLLSAEKIEEFRREGADVAWGAFGENLVVSGFDLRKIPVGTKLKCGDAVLELTQIGKDCHTHCQIYHRMGKCIMPVEGVFARVLQGGQIHCGDAFDVCKNQEPRRLSAAVITLSDRSFRGVREDRSGPVVVEYLEKAGYQVEETVLLPDEKEGLKKTLIRLADQRQINLILTTGGTGFSMRDVTPEATLEVMDRNAPGIAEAIRAYSIQITPKGMLSRGVSVFRGRSLIVNLPGSPKAVAEILEYILPPLEHGVRVCAGLDDN